MLKFKQFVNLILEKKTNKEVTSNLVSAYPDLFGTHSTNNRVKNLKNISIEEFAEIIKKTFNVEIMAINPPYKSGSSKFYSVQFNLDGDTKNILLAGKAIPSTGHEFEEVLSKDLMNINITGDTNPKEYRYKNLIEDIIKEFKITGESKLNVRSEGSANKKRGISFSSRGGLIVGTGQLDVGSTVSDITLTVDDSTKYLSLKKGNTVQFSNMGTTSFFTKRDIENSKITNKEAKSLLDLFEIDEKTFCEVFNLYGKNDFREFHSQINPKNKEMIEDFIESCVGYGYWMIHLSDNQKTYQFYEVTESVMKSYSKIKGPIKIFYGGVSGKGKQVYVEVETDELIFQIDFRNRAGGINPNAMGTKYQYKNWKGLSVS
jgi:hypothetical protein